MVRTSNNPALILIHGFRGAPSGLEAIANILKTAGYPVYTPAISPFAGAKALSEYTPKAYADFIARYIVEQHLLQPILIGHSMGSTITAATASFYPNLIHQKIILLAPISAKPSTFFSVLSPLSAYFPRQIVDHVTTQFLFVKDGKSYSRAENRTIFRNIVKTTTICSKNCPPKKPATIAAAKFSVTHSVEDFVFNKDTMIIAGEHDRLISQQSTIQLAQKLHAQLNFIPNSGHLHNYEKPLETSKLILDFIKRT